MALREKYSLLPQRNGLTEKRKVIIGYVHLEMLTSIQVECGELSKVYWFNYKYNWWLLGGFCYCNTIFDSRWKSTEKFKQGRNKVNRELWPDAYNLHGKDVPLKSWIYKFENWL